MISEKRPIIQFKNEQIDTFFEYGSYLIVFLLILYTALHYVQLPETIPTHFDFSGKPDGYGSKEALWIIPGIISFLIILFKILSRNPHQFNYIRLITIENAEREYRMSVRVLKILQFNISILFSYITIIVIRGASQQKAELGIWFIPILIISIISPVFYLMWSSSTRNGWKK